MKILNDRRIKQQFAILLVILLVFILLGQLLVRQMTKEYIADRIEHDYAVAGVLMNSGLTGENITSAFIQGEAYEKVDQGRQLLSQAGYQPKLSQGLLREASELYHRYSLRMLLLTFTLSVGVLFLFLWYHNRTYKEFNEANQTLREFLEGNVNARLKDNEEGITSLLYSTVNQMATSLTAHISMEQKNKEFLQDTISDISHQLKTPLAALQMYNEIILEEDLNQVTIDFTKKSQRELYRMEYLIKNLLKLARLDAGTILLNKTELNLNEYLQEIINHYQTKAETKKISLSLSCPPGITHEMDEEWMAEAIGNLVNNALEHTASGGKVDIMVSDTAALLEIIVQDNGAGIHPEDLPYIFQRFYQSRFSKKQHGIGIGLTLARAIIEKHGGSIQVSSEINRGSTFRIILSKLSA